MIGLCFIVSDAILPAYSKTSKKEEESNADVIGRIERNHVSVIPLGNICSLKEGGTATHMRFKQSDFEAYFRIRRPRFRDRHLFYTIPEPS